MRHADPQVRMLTACFNTREMLALGSSLSSIDDMVCLCVYINGGERKSEHDTSALDQF